MNFVITNRYRSDQILINHAYGTIYSGYDLVNYNPVIIWLMPNSQRSKYLFNFYENYPADLLLHLIDYGTEVTINQIYSIFKYINLIPFHKYIKDNHLNFYQLLNIYNKMIVNLKLLHENNLVHGRLFPINIIFTNDEPIIIGLGITNLFLIKDIPYPEKSFLAPEVISGNAPSIESDFFSIAGILYYLLSKSELQNNNNDSHSLSVSDLNILISLLNTKEFNDNFELSHQIKIHLENGLHPIQNLRVLVPIQL